MKRLKGLKQPIKNLEGREMQEMTGLFIDPTTSGIVPEGTEGAVPQTRDILPGRIIGAALHNSEAAPEGKPSYFDPYLVDKLARAFYGAKDTLDLEDAEYGIACTLFKMATRPYWVAVPCQQVLDDAEDVKKKSAA